jgi:small-conductance mechanosensitive channel
VASFGDAGVNLELGVFVRDPLVDQVDLKSRIYRSILRRFADADIALAYPRRDLGGRLSVSDEAPRRHSAPRS